MKKKLVAIMMTMTLLAGVMAGCGSDSKTTVDVVDSTNTSETTDATSGEATGDLLSQIQEKGEITIATEGTWSPWTYHDENDELVGFDVEVATAIAEKLGVKATFVEGEFDGLLAGIEAGRYDIMANGIEVTDERSEKYDFSDPYAYIRTAIIVAGNNDSIQSFEDLDGKQTANTLTSTYAALAESYGATATGVDDLNQTIELLLAGRVDATLNAEDTYYDYMKAHPDADLKIAALTEEASQVAIPMRKGEDTASLREAVNQAVKELREDGTLSELSNKYFGSDITAE